MWQDLPPPERPRQKGQAPQEAQVRFDQAHGALSGEARARDQGQEGRCHRRAKEQAYRQEGCCQMRNSLESQTTVNRVSH